MTYLPKVTLFFFFLKRFLKNPRRWRYGEIAPSVTRRQADVILITEACKSCQAIARELLCRALVKEREKVLLCTTQFSWL